MKLVFSRQIFEKNIQISIFTKIRPVGTELFRADRRTDGREVNIRFSQFCGRA